MTKQEQKELLLKVASQIYSNNVADFNDPVGRVPDSIAATAARNAYELAKIFVDVTQENEGDPKFQVLFL